MLSVAVDRDERVEPDFCESHAEGLEEGRPLSAVLRERDDAHATSARRGKSAEDFAGFVGRPVIHRDQLIGVADGLADHLAAEGADVVAGNDTADAGAVAGRVLSLRGVGGRRNSEPAGPVQEPEWALDLD